MDARARHILSILRDNKVSSETIIAGGAVRDTFFNLEPKDYDFFIPFDYNTLDLLTKKIGKKPVKSAKNYKYSKSLPIVDVFNWDFEGIDVQVMLTKFQNNDDFTKSVMDSFDFGINKIYYDNSFILRDTEEFQNDYQNCIMTLYHLTDLKYLPKYVDRYMRINKKLGGMYEFKCPRLKLVDEEKPIETKGLKAEWVWADGAVNDRVIRANLGAAAAFDPDVIEWANNVLRPLGQVPPVDNVGIAENILRIQDDFIRNN